MVNGRGRGSSSSAVVVRWQRSILWSLAKKPICIQQVSLCYSLQNMLTVSSSQWCGWRAYDSWVVTCW